MRITDEWDPGAYGGTRDQDLLSRTQQWDPKVEP